MNKAKTERDKAVIYREWMALPEAERQTEDHAVAFAMRMSPHYQFKRVSDSYQLIKVWACEWLPSPRPPVMKGYAPWG
jgi:hypothetical protein